jgi:hypothetical protein
MLTEEFVEALIGIKMEFNTPIHEHPWICECQEIVPQELQKVNYSEIDLRTLKYKSIEQVDEEMKIYFREQFNAMSEEEFIGYLKAKYNNDNSIIYKKTPENIDKEIEQVKVKEPIIVFDEARNSYAFRFMRIKDILNAQKVTEYKYAGRIKGIKNKEYSKDSVVDAKTQREKEIDSLKYQQAKDTLLFARAFSLLSYNGKSLSSDEAITIYKNAPRGVLMQIKEFMDKLQFGVYDERELTCPQCGQVSKRLLRQEINPFELLPLDSDTKRKQRKSTSINVYFGV